MTGTRRLRRWLGHNGLRIYAVIAFAYIFTPIVYIAVFIVQQRRQGQPHLARLHDGQLDEPLRGARRLQRPRQQPEDRGPGHGRRDRARHDGRVRAGPAPLPRPDRDEPADLPADGHARGRARGVAAHAVPQHRGRPGLRDDRHRPRDVLHQLRRGRREGADRQPGPAAGAGRDGPLRQRGPDLPPGHPAAGGAGHRRRRPARLQPVVRRLHHHELHLGLGEHLPEVRVRLGPARHPRPGVRDRVFMFVLAFLIVVGSELVRGRRARLQRG